MEAQEFAGKDGFVWFTGVVEGRADPAQLGRVQVRIIGWHDSNKNLVPTELLPWAQVLLPVNGQRTMSVPKEGEWVMGFFQDGKNGQMPVILGVYPGIVPAQQTTYINQQGFGIDLTKSGLSAITSTANTPGTPPVGVVGDVKSEPTTPRIARGEMANTIVDKQNNDLSHVCDFISEMQKNMKLRQYMRTVAQAIRDGIRKVLLALGIGDATGKGTWAINMLKAIARELRWFNKTILKPILDFEKYVLAYITKMRAIIQWILSLPEKFLKMLQDCLSKFLKLIGAIFTDTIGGFKEGMELNSEGNFSELIKEAKDVANAAGETLTALNNIASNAIAIPVAATAGLLQPTTQSEVDAANAFIKEYEGSSDNKVTSPTEGMKAP